MTMPTFIKRSVLGGFGAALLLPLALAAPAFAQSPWWHLTSGTRPLYLHSGVARNEVQDLTVSATGGSFRILEPVAAAHGEFKIVEFQVEAGKGPEASVLQKGLEEEVYGKGNVQVAGGPGDENGTKPYVIMFIGALADQPVQPMQPINEVTGGKAEAVVSEAVRGRPDGEINVIAENVGDASTGGKAPVRIGDVLPGGLKAVAIAGERLIPGAFQEHASLQCAIEMLSCGTTAPVAPFEQLEERISVVVQAGATAGEVNSATINGGGAASVAATGSTKLSEAPIPFGVEEYTLVNEQEGGALVVQAGQHPFQQTTSFTLNQTADRQPPGDAIPRGNNPAPIVSPAALVKDVQIKWPPGLIGNPSSTPRCPLSQFLSRSAEMIANEIEGNQCPAQTAVGVATVTFEEHKSVGYVDNAVPLFNLEPAKGEPARFGFVVQNVNQVIIDTSLRTGGDYGITVSVHNIQQDIAFLSSQVTVWGVPGDPSHSAQRGWGCLMATHSRPPGGRLPCVSLEEHQPAPFLVLPTSCGANPQSTVEVDSWEHPGALTAPLSSAESMPLLNPLLAGCNRLSFEPEIKVSPDGQAASTPTGLVTDVHVPQNVNENAAGLASSNVKAITVKLPEGVTLNPAAADGLQACSESEIGYLPAESSPPGDLHFTPRLPGSVDALAAGEEEPLKPGVNFCPDAAKVATVKIKTPLLPNPLEGAVYLASPQNFQVFPQENPFSSLVAMYIVAEDPISGSLVKLPGTVALNETTGQITATFENTPQLAFEDAELHFFGGARAPLATPAHCGTYTTEATFTPWSGNPPVKSTSSFEVKTGPNGGPCPGTLPFSPSLAAGSQNINAGSFSPLTTTISREDGNQNIQTVQLHMAPGMSGILAGVPLCPEAQANAGTCGEESRIGETIVSVGLGGDPYTVTGGKVYLTEKYGGGAFGLSIVNPADAGPFHLGKVIVRASIQIDPRTAALTITTGNIPHIIDGFPLQIKHVNVTITRPNFTFNPTNCNAQSVTGTIGSVEGATSPVSVPFQVTNCAALKFTPKVSVTSAAKTSKANGASLFFKISYPKGAQGSESWFSEAKFDLPKQLPARLTTLQKACLASVFESNPAACPVASVIGHAVVHTQVLPVPLAGPVYFVSHGGAKFPDAVLLLQGDGVTVDLTGQTFINGKTGITSATFANTPDVPFENIEVTVPTGPFSEFAANLPAKAKGSLCGQKLLMPTRFKAQNGLEITQNTAIGVTGCAKAKKLTRAQLLAKAMKACKKKPKSRRAMCARTARRKYGPLKKKG